MKISIILVVLSFFVFSCASPMANINVRNSDEFFKNAKYPTKADISAALDLNILNNEIVYSYIDGNYNNCILKLSKRIWGKCSILDEDTLELKRAVVDCFFVIFNREKDVPDFASYSKIEEAVFIQRALAISYEKIDRIFKRFTKRFPSEYAQQDIKVKLAELKMKIGKIEANVARYYYYGAFYESHI